MKLVFVLESGKYIKEFENSDVYPVKGETVIVDKTRINYIVVDILADYPSGTTICFLELKN